MLSNLEEISWKNANKVFEDADGRIRLKRPEHFLNMTSRVKMKNPKHCWFKVRQRGRFKRRKLV